MTRRAFPGASAYVDRHGRRRFRYRAKGFSAELGSEWGSPEFVRRYELARRGQKDTSARRAAPGTVAAVVASYLGSAAYRDLADLTQRAYRGALDKLRTDHGDKRVAKLEPRHVRRLMAQASTANAANFRLKVLRALMRHAVEIGVIERDPTREVRKYRVATQGYHAWDEGEIARFYERHAPGTTAHLALTLMLYTGAARVDACRLGWSNVGDGRLRYRRQKTKRSGGVLIDIPIHAELQAALDRVPRDRFTFLETSQGKARAPAGLGNAMRRWCDEAGLSECTAHGLRKACARRLAEAGCTDAQIMAITGHKSRAELTRYTAAMDRSGLADEAMDRLGEAAPNRSAQVANHPKRFANSPANSLRKRGNDEGLAAPTGFEPATSGLKGRRPDR